MVGEIHQTRSQSISWKHLLSLQERLGLNGKEYEIQDYYNHFNHKLTLIQIFQTI